MPIYVTLLKNTAQGAKEIKDFGKAVEEAAGWIATDGGKVLGAYALQGHYDFLWITEYPDTKGIGKSLRSEEHTSELQSPDHLVCRLLLEKKKQIRTV